MRRRIGTGSALLLGMFAFGSTQAAACDWACWWGWCRGYGYYAAPAPAYYAPPAYTSSAPAPAYYDPPAYTYSAPAPAYYEPPAYSYAPPPAYYPGPGYAADAPPPVSHSP